MTIKVIATEKAPAAIGPYSQGIEAGGFVYTSGQLPIDMSSGDLVLDDIRLATRASLENCRSILLEAGLNLENVVKTLIFITDMEDFQAVNEEYEKYFSEHKPARSCIEVSRLPKDARVEIELVAYRG